MKPNQVKQLVFSAIGLALVFLCTFLIKIPSPVEGYFNLGDAMIMIFCTMSPVGLSFVLAGVGSMMADFVGGFGQYALFTLVVKGCEGALVSYMTKRFGKSKRLFTLILAAIVMVAGYFVTDWILFGALVGVADIWLNILQGAVGVVIAMILIPRLRRYYRQMFIKKGVQ